MGQANRFFLNRFPAGMKSANVIGEIAGEKTMLSALDGLFESFAGLCFALFSLGAGGKEAGVENADCKAK
jgi:hypothetical protein